MKREKPLLIFDGDCNFCRKWIFRWRFYTQDKVDYAPYQKAAPQFPQIPEENFQKSVQLVETDGSVYTGAEAVFRTLAYSKGRGWLYWMYRIIPLFKPITEAVYRFVAHHRSLFSTVTACLWGTNLSPSTFNISSWLFLRALGVIYLIAFISLAVQIKGLIGSDGIIPAQAFLAAVSERVGLERFWFLPSLFWLDSSDFFIQFVCWAGAALSILLIIGLVQIPLLVLLWILYLSVYSVSGDFLSFQWDILLLEAGFLSIFLAPLSFNLFRPSRPFDAKPSGIVLFLFRWLLFRLIFLSGIVKLASGDPAWRNGTALSYHYETQPLPTLASWFVHQLPMWFQKLSAVSMFALELAVPFLIFAPRRLRTVGAWILILFQISIIVTGNYGFFNYLSIALCLFMIDDQFWSWILKKIQLPEMRSARRWPKWLLLPFAGLVLLMSLIQFSGSFRMRIVLPLPIATLYQIVEPFHIVNSYGLFAVMTHERPEIIIEGSRDGISWKPYVFKFKPGPLNRAPGYVAPYQPRLDWQMWFAALGNYRTSPWFAAFCTRLLEGSQDVLSLLDENPFPDRPPRFIRGVLYRYKFTRPDEKKEDGNWWRRERVGNFTPMLSL